MIDFRLPSLGADMERAKLVEWLVKPGQRVKRGDLVAIIETDKGAVELEIWDEGVVEALVGQVDHDIAVGEVLARLRTDSEDAPPSADASAEQSAEASAGNKAEGNVKHDGETSAEVKVTSSTPGVAPSPARVKISPAARRLAQELGVDIEGLRPTHADGILSLADVQAAATGRSGPAPVADRQAAMQAAIAAAMAKSKREIPHYYLGNTMDVGRALDWLTQENAKRDVKSRLLFAALLLKAVAVTLKESNGFNGHWIDGQFLPASDVHLGVAIALRGGGLIAPALRDADRMPLTDLMQALTSLIQRARGGALRSSELTDATATVTHLGDLGVDTVYGVIYPPQVALFGFGKVVERPWVREGKVTVTRVLHATLSADHRASVGHQGAALLSALERRLNTPESL